MQLHDYPVTDSFFSYASPLTETWETWLVMTLFADGSHSRVPAESPVPVSEDPRHCRCMRTRKSHWYGCFLDPYACGCTIIITTINYNISHRVFEFFCTRKLRSGRVTMLLRASHDRHAYRQTLLRTTTAFVTDETLPVCPATIKKQYWSAVYNK